MPIRVVNGFADPQVVKDAIGEEYIIFYSSIMDGKMWCPDCRDVEILVNRTFCGENSPSALIVYVGDRAEWRIPSNPFRGGAWKVTSVPTIIRIKDAS
ncbi:hypothetical protein E4T56_gene2570 [Termitomyces sp. T112]|nr:hypothetical protein E4T56_gene2570 [Termitomyces sp. T112]